MTSQWPPRSVPTLRIILSFFKYSRSLCIVLCDTSNLCDKVVAFSTTLSVTQYSTRCVSIINRILTWFLWLMGYKNVVLFLLGYSSILFPKKIESRM